jgi:hypothetical protein
MVVPGKNRGVAQKYLIKIKELGRRCNYVWCFPEKNAESLKTEIAF